MYYPGGIFQHFYVGTWTLGTQEDYARFGAQRRITWGDKACERTLGGRKQHDASVDSYVPMMQHTLYDEWWQTNQSTENLLPKRRPLC
ncbi:hypothetical protein [Bradyrhizobium sp. USDA 4011]